MAALAALAALWLLAPQLQVRPLLIEAARFDVPATARMITVGGSGACYVADPERHLVTRWTLDGGRGPEVGGYGWGLSALDHPSGVATDGNRVYVADRGNHRIVSYDRDLRPLNAFSTRDTADARSRFGYPDAVAVSGRGDLIVLDGESDDVVGFRPDRRVAFRIGREVSGGPPLSSPTCVSVDRAERLLVGEAGGIRMFDLFGNQLRSIRLAEGLVVRGTGGSGRWLAAVSADTLFLYDDERSLVFRWGRSEIIPGSAISELWGLAWHEGSLVVLSTGSVVILRVES